MRNSLHKILFAVALVASSASFAAPSSQELVARMQEVSNPQIRFSRAAAKDLKEAYLAVLNRMQELQEEINNGNAGANKEMQMLASSLGDSFVTLSDGSFNDVPNTQEGLNKVASLLSKLTKGGRNQDASLQRGDFRNNPAVQWMEKTMARIGDVVQVIWRDLSNLAGFQSPDGWDPLGLRQRRRSKSMAFVIREVRGRTLDIEDAGKEAANKEVLEQYRVVFNNVAKAKPVEDSVFHQRVIYANVGLAIFWFFQPFDFFPERTRFSTEIAGDIEVLTNLLLYWSHYHNQGLEIPQSMFRSEKWLRLKQEGKDFKAACHVALRTIMFKQP